LDGGRPRRRGADGGALVAVLLAMLMIYSALVMRDGGSWRVAVAMPAILGIVAVQMARWTSQTWGRSHRRTLRRLFDILGPETGPGGRDVAELAGRSDGQTPEGR
ncbi:hypothetical protein ABZ351_37880, partial [Streptomyces microflavus]|uniref:hypothetical protein n=1 Tax=Streptomyces microflavus TaxID=1919 RepID=UPI0033D648D5